MGESKIDMDDLHRANKLLSRETREQSIELRALKKENAQLIDQLRHHSERADKHRELERHKFYEHFGALEDQIAYLKQELQRRKALAESLTMQTREANDEKGNFEQAVRRLQHQNRELSENLTECKDDLLRLQPPSGVPDSEVAEQYSNLMQQVSRWVDDVTEDAQAIEARFDALAKHDNLPKQLQPYLTSELVRLGSKKPNAQPYILRFVIHQFLEDCMLGNGIYLFGLDTRTTALLEGVERGMKELEPSRGWSSPIESAYPLA